MSFELSLEADPGQIVTAMLDANHPVVIVGRKRGSGLTTTNRTVSREHAEFRWQDGQIAVRDLDSTGGTFINGKRVQHGVLGLGDSVACGKLEVRIRDLGGSGASRRMTSEDSDGGGGGGGGTAVLDAYQPMDMDELAPAPRSRGGGGSSAAPERPAPVIDRADPGVETFAPSQQAAPEAPVIEEVEPEDSAPSEALVFTYVDTDGTSGTFEVTPTSGEVVVGRGKHADVRVKHKTVSRKHCSLVWREGKVEVADLQSSAGTYVAGRKVSRQLVSPGQVIAVGKLEMTLNGSGGAQPSVNRTGPWSLVFRDIEGNEFRHKLGPGDAAITIGRGKAATIRIQESTAGREHCRITYSAGALHVADLESRNGTYINDEKITEGTLAAGDILRCGSFPITIEAPLREGAIEDWEENWDDDWTDLDAMAPPWWHLVYTTDDGRVEHESLNPALRIIALGSDSDCEICIEKSGVEPDHCEFTWEEGVLVANDLETEVGTLVRDKPIDERVMKNGDVLVAGEFRMHVVRGAGRGGRSKGKRGDDAVAWAERFEAKDSSLCLVYCYGDESDPSFPDIGKVELTLWGDGEARVEVTTAQGRVQGIGTVHEEVVRLILKALDYAGYPAVPEATGGDEACPVELSAYQDDDEVTALISHKNMNRIEHYREAIELLRAIAYELECGAAEV
ncbi:MAG: FHA domain-containing protein [Myxococcota bacterium]